MLADHHRLFRAPSKFHQFDGFSETLGLLIGLLRRIFSSDALWTHIVLYLLPESIEELTPRLVDALNNGTILVCNTWGPKSFQPVEHRVCGQDNQINLYKYSRESIPNIEAMMMRRHDSEPMDMDQLDKDMDVGA